MILILYARMTLYLLSAMALIGLALYGSGKIHHEKLWLAGFFLLLQIAVYLRVLEIPLVVRDAYADYMLTPVTLFVCLALWRTLLRLNRR